MIARDAADEAFSVASFETDFTGHLTIHSLFNRFQDLAGAHAEHLGVGFDKLREMGLAWLLSRVKVRILNLPRWGEPVTLKTWPKGVDRLFALRDFRLTNAGGETLVLATTCWLLVDMEKGKPIRIQTLDVDLMFPHAEHAVREIPDKIPTPPSLVPAFDMKVLPSDLDVNEHVNNAHYVRWITDCFDVERLRTRRINTFQVNYLRQVLKGDHVALSVGMVTQSPDRHYVQGVSWLEGVPAFQALIEWE